jgi:transcriptional regulator with XRE-family HTH domain
MPADVARQFAANLRKARHCAGLSQEEVGWLASLHRTEIGLLETGARTPRIDTLVKIAAAVDVPVECPLLDGITWNPGSTRAGAFSLVAQTSAPQERDELEGD